MSSSKEGKRRNLRNPKKPGYFNYLFFVGVAFILSGCAIFVLTYFPVVKEEARYLVRPKISDEIRPVNRDFSIVIPKIRANTPIIANVNPYIAQEYQSALTRGVAHALGSALPGHAGNSFIFAHSSSDWYTANRYNSVFYLLHKLEKKDKIEVYYKGKKYSYEVTEKKYVNPNDVSYLKSDSSEGESTITLMTCWPPGTTLKRLVVTARLLSASL